MTKSQKSIAVAAIVAGSASGVGSVLAQLSRIRVAVEEGHLEFAASIQAQLSATLVAVAVLAVITVTGLTFMFLPSGILRSKLRERHKGSLVFSARNFHASLSEGILPEPLKLKRRMTLGMVADGRGISVWSGTVEPVLIVELPWDAIDRVAAGEISEPTVAKTIVISSRRHDRRLEFALVHERLGAHRVADEEAVQALLDKLTELRGQNVPAA